ncbi:hypothetical protein K2173_025748 [Erythroxylum novogranatense]|uniref:Uncharacterized protein n=1 Tax=Erythroxylum novogranatense TaxID=1862640 RepID=A0AAV8T3S3_9ROSI|nr:hypothetical protein K2173_025748 [Erythroxylum novogranatense]
MGNKHSTTGYYRLHHSDRDFITKPLLAPDTEVMEQTLPEKVASLEEAVKEIKSCVSSMETKFQSIISRNSCSKTLVEKKREEGIETMKKKQVALERKVKELTDIVKGMQSPESANSKVPTVIQSGILNSIPDLIDMRDQAVCVTDKPTKVVSDTTPSSELHIWSSEVQSSNDPVDDLNGCLVVLIFLVAILIGLFL